MIVQSRFIDRPVDEVAQVFDGPVRTWLPVIAGAAPATWRTDAREGLVRVRVVIEASSVWVLPDGTHRRHLRVEPDRSSFRDLVTAMLTPRLQGDLVLRSADEDRAATVTFEGRSTARSRMTGALERLIIGTPLARSGLHDLLDHIAERLATASVPPRAAGDHERRVDGVVVRPRRRGPLARG